MRDRLRILLASLFLLTVSLPVLVFSQQVPNGGTHGAASDSSSRMSPARTGATEQPASPHETANGIEQDYSEALSLVEEDYVDGAKIDYGNVFKSSIIGMLRSLDPHSNYYDRKEFEELRNEWRSEYFGIGASIGDRKVG